MPASTIFADKWARLGFALAAATMIAGFWLRPLWRDEYWALYFSGLGRPLDASIETMARDVHPPLYFIVLHFWRMVSADPLWARLFNLIAFAAAGWAGWALRGARPRETALFLFLCATAYWAIYFGVEVRMMGVLFALCALSALVMRNALDAPERASRAAALFAVLGAIASFTHFFGALWAACGGAAVGLALLAQRRVGGFLCWAGASIAAISPAAIWIVLVRPDHNPGAAALPAPMLTELTYALNQFGRGLFVKTLGANLAGTVAAILAAGWLVRSRDRAAPALALAAALTVVIAFAIHLFWAPLIKERAFIVMMPAIILLMAAAIEAVRPEQRIATRAAALIPLFACLSPLLFSSEYFKDREKIGPLRAIIAAQGVACRGAPVLAYIRPSDQASDFNVFFTRSVLAGAADGGDLSILDAATVKAPPVTDCPVKAVALALPRGEGQQQEVAAATLSAAGAPLRDWERRSFGGGRSLVWLAPAQAEKAAP